MKKVVAGGPSNGEEEEEEEMSNISDGDAKREKSLPPSCVQRLQYPPMNPHPSSSMILSKEIRSAAVALSAAAAESLPETPLGWTFLLTTCAAASLAYERAIQRQLTAPPLVYGQVQYCVLDHNNYINNNNNSVYDVPPIAQVYQTMKSQPNSIITRPIQPSLLVGTRATLSSAMAYWSAGPKARTEPHVQFREILTLPADGAQVALDWELPSSSASSQLLSVAERQHQVLHGPITQPVVLILHGINNHAGFGYMQSLMRACTDRGWIAAGFNFRGCTIPLQTPRIYNGAYTGDLRSVVQYLSRRFVVPSGSSSSQQQCKLLFLVGNSLGANLVAKYLGEEGRCGSLPECVAGGVTMGNPMRMYSGDMNRFYSPIIAMGAKRGLLSVLRSSLWGMCQTKHYRDCVRNALLAPTLEAFDEAVAPIFVRNDPDYPFAQSVGYHPQPPHPNGTTTMSTGRAAQAYGWDASSFRQVPFVSVPLLQLIAKDDFLVFSPFNSKLAYNLCNPNVMVMETTCGGHLGWHEAHPNGGWGGSSWADTAMVDFVQAVLDTQQRQQQHPAEANISKANYTDAMPMQTDLRQQQQQQQQRTVQQRLAQNTELRSRL